MRPIKDLVRDCIKVLKPYSSARDEYKEVLIEEMIFLDANENPFENGLNRYPDPQQNKVKQALSKNNGIHRKNIFLGNGSDEVLDLIFRAFCEPNKDNIITLPPTYGMYSVLANINGIEDRKVMLSTDFQPKVEQILSSVDKNTKVLFLCSPNNPTGNSFSTEKVETLLQRFPGLVLIDEAYIDFSKQESWANQLRIYPNLVITQTLSKAYGMAGIRLGICYASEEIIQILNKIKPPYNVNELTQQKAVERLQDRERVAQEIASILSERNHLSIALEEISFIEKIYASDANFILIKVDDATKRYNQLIANGIVIRNRTNQPLCENTLRLTVGIKEENEKLMKGLKDLQGY